MNPILITGTDTGVGKTWVACALGRALTATGRRVVAIKPVETGCTDGARGAEDGVLLAAATGQTEPREALDRFAEPLAPVLAAEAEGRTIDFDALVLQVESLGENADVVLIEGVGGLLAPITWEWTMVDLARALDASALVVGADRLGVINHSLLTLSDLELAGIEVTGMVLSAPEKADRSTGTNVPAIMKLSGVDRVARVARLTDPGEAAVAVAPLLEWIGPS